MKKPWHHLYKTAHWKALRLRQLSQEPLCRYCEQQGRVEAAAVVDHIKPHKGDPELFHNPFNLQSLCKQHHDSTKQAEERKGITIGNNTKGFPIDPGHHWN